jgi:hypothetical protein
MRVMRAFDGQYLHNLVCGGINNVAAWADAASKNTVT